MAAHVDRARWMNQMAGDDMVNCTRHDGSNNVGFYWVDPTVHSPTEEISAVWRGWGEKFDSRNSKCIRTSQEGRGVNFQFHSWGR